MAIINIQTPENATGKVKDFYDELLKIMPLIPKPVQLSSASSTYFSNYTQRLKYFFAHPTLSPTLQAYIRMIVAFKIDYPYCVDSNIENLKALGLSDEQIAAARNSDAQNARDESDRATMEAILATMSSGVELYKHITSNESLKKWIQDMVFSTTYKAPPPEKGRPAE